MKSRNLERYPAWSDAQEALKYITKVLEKTIFI